MNELFGAPAKSLPVFSDADREGASILNALFHDTAAQVDWNGTPAEALAEANPVDAAMAQGDARQPSEAPLAAPVETDKGTANTPEPVNEPVDTTLVAEPPAGQGESAAAGVQSISLDDLFGAPTASGESVALDGPREHPHEPAQDSSKELDESANEPHDKPFLTPDMPATATEPVQPDIALPSATSEPAPAQDELEAPRPQGFKASLLSILHMATPSALKTTRDEPAGAKDTLGEAAEAPASAAPAATAAAELAARLPPAVSREEFVPRIKEMLDVRITTMIS